MKKRVSGAYWEHSDAEPQMVGASTDFDFSDSESESLASSDEARAVDPGA